MFFHIQNLINPIAADEPDPAAANILQEGLGGQFGEMRTMMQYLFQSFNARGDAKPFKDLIQGVGIEEISHVELITTTINMLLDGSARYQGRASTAKLKTISGKRANVVVPGSGGTTPLDVAPGAPNTHHFIVAPQCAMPVDAAGNPWSGSYVYASGNLVLDFDSTQYPEVKKLMDLGAHLKQHHFRLDGSEMGKIFHGNSPANDGLEVETTEKAPEGAPIAGLPDRPEEFAPGLTPELLEMVAAVKRFK